MKNLTFPAEFLLYIVSMKRCHAAKIAFYRGPGMCDFICSGRWIDSFFYLGVRRFLDECSGFIIEVNVVWAMFIRMLYPASDGRMAAPAFKTDY